MPDFLDNVLIAGGANPGKSPLDDVLAAGSHDATIDQARSRVITAAPNPKQAAESLQIADTMKIDPQVVNKQYEQYKALFGHQRAISLLNENPDIARYINSHPMAASVSSDDYANLDKFTKAAKQSPSILHAAVEGFKEGAGPGGLGFWLTDDDIKNHRFLAAITSSAVVLPEYILRMLSGATASIGRAGEAAAVNAGADPDTAKKYANNFIQAAGDPGLWASTPLGELIGAPFINMAHNAVLKETMGIKPYIEQGRVPPPGVSPVTDKMHADQAKADLKGLQDSLKAAEATETRERNPELFKSLADEVTKGDIGVSADAIKTLYGDKVPAADDGLLGWVPRLQEQLEAAQATGADIQISIADWLTYAKSEGAKQIEEHIRVRPDGMTVAEAKEGIEAYHPVGANPNEITPLPAGFTVEASKLHVHMLEAGEGSSRYLQIKDPNGVTVLEATLNKHGDDYQLNHIVNNSKWLSESPYSTVSRYTNLGEAAYIEAAKIAEAEGKKLFVGASGETSRFAKRIHESLFKKGYATAPNEYGTREVRSTAKQEAKEGIEAYHGSPHEFEAFANEKIGTGEGAQSYGYGHYVAENPAVAADYQDKLAGTKKSVVSVQQQGGKFYTYDEFGSVVGGPFDTLAEAQSKGNLYKVRVRRNPEEFLDWDRPLAEQGEIGAKVADIGKRWLYGTEHYQANGMTGADVYKGIEAIEGKEEATRALSEAGIPGIKYLDQGSRALPKVTQEGDLWKATYREAGERIERDFKTKEEADAFAASKGQPTSNYVVFDPADIEIISRNGEALRAAQKEAALPPLASDLTTTLELAAKQAEALDKARDTKKWREEAAQVRSVIADQINEQPAHQLDKALREGQLRIAEANLTAEQKAALPPEWIAKKGIHPEDLAKFYGTPTADDLLTQLSTLVAERAQTGLRADDYRRGLIRDAVDKVMEAKWNQEHGILEDAQAAMLSQERLDQLHAATVELGAKAGVDFNATKALLAREVDGLFGALTVKEAKVGKYLTLAGRAGRAIGKALSDGDVKTAFDQQRRQYATIMLARKAKAFEKTVDQFDRFAERHSARSLPSMDQEYLNWIHDVLLRVEQPIKRSVQDLQESLGRGGDTGQKTLQDFVDYKNTHDLREVTVAEFLTDPEFKSATNALTTDQFHQMNESLKSMAENGRDEQKVYKAGEARDFNEVRDQMLETLQRFNKAKRDIKGNKIEFASGIRHLGRVILASHLQVETVLNRLDKWNPGGVWTQYLFRPLAEAANHEARLERKYSEQMRKIADGADMREVIPNSPFVVPRSENTATMTRKNLRAVLLNMGNESNFNKLVAGHLHDLDGIEPGENHLAIFKEQVRQWAHTYATKADWDWAQKVWDMFGAVKKEADVMYRNVAGIEPEALRVEPIQTPHGTYAGGYYPLIRNEFYGENLKFDKADLEGQGYTRAFTPAGYTKQRTGAIYPLELDLDAMPGKLKQVIHDISFRPAVIQASKFVYDKKLMQEFKDRLGPEQANLLQPWLKDIANQQNFMASKDMKELSYWADFFRQNVTTTLVGLNPSTFMKHTPTAMISSMAEVGPKNFLDALKSLTFINEESGQSNWGFAMKTSEELQRRHRNWAETLTGGIAELQGTTTLKALKSGEYNEAFMSLRNTMANFSSKPVALGDLFSAVPTWLAKYKQAMEEHGVHGDAVFEADKAVRQAHGSTGMPSKSSVARASSLRWFTGFFTFFNDLLNRQIETLWKAGEIKGLVESGQKKEALKMGQNVAGRLTAYVLMPALIEELVTPLASEQNESWAKKAAKGLTFTLAASWVGARDIANAVLNGRDPSAGLVSTLYKTPADLIRDFGSKQRVKPENVIKHGAQLSGFLTGMPPAQVGRTAAGAYRYGQGQERPKGPWGWLVLGRYGTLDKHSQTFDDYLKHH